MKKTLVILGPTATGKTGLGLFLAKKFNGELVSCDSRQVYTGLNIGTGKFPGDGKWEVRRGKGFWEIGGIRVWMYDVVNPKKQYTVVDYVKDAMRVIREIEERGKLPIVVGGAGLYLKALLYGLPNLAIPVDQRLRVKLVKLSKAELQQKLQRLSPKRWNSLNDSDRKNPRRLVRAIELVMYPGRGLKIYDLRFNNFNSLKIGLTAPREMLYQRVDERVVSRIKQGMVAEAKELQKGGLTIKRMKALGLEYGVLADYLACKIKTRQDLIKIMQGQIHGYVRRQLTWFKKENDVYWFDVNERMMMGRIENLVRQWYDIGV